MHRKFFISALVLSRDLLNRIIVHECEYRFSSSLDARDEGHVPNEAKAIGAV